MASSSPLRFQLIAAVLARLVVNTAHRMFYPFLPEFSRGLGLPPTALFSILSIRNALGVTSPAFGLIPDRLGRKAAMLIGLGVFCIGLTVAGLWPLYSTLLAMAIALMITKFIFDPALLAYLGDRVPYAQRGLVIAITEMGWSGAALVGIPLVGWWIETTGQWHAPFLPLAFLGFLTAVSLAWLIPVETAHAQARTQRAPWAAVWRNRRVLAALTMGLLVSMSQENFLAIYGVWLERDFGLPVVERGLTLIVIGLAELAGEGLVMWLADRLGKRRALMLGLVLSATTALALPFLAGALGSALVGLGVMFVAFEFTIVASLPLMTELAPEARGTAMSANAASHALGRMGGVWLGSQLFALGLFWNGLATALLNLAGLYLVLYFVREHASVS